MDIPEMTFGQWRVEKFFISENDAKLSNMRTAMHAGQGGMFISPGNYTRLMRGGVIVMSDTPAEINESISIINNAIGSVLINGLGLGYVLEEVIRKPGIIDITVIEIDKDLIDNVGEYYLNKYINFPLEIINADALQWNAPPWRRYNAVWNDIWDYICIDNWPEYVKLHRKYSKRKADWVGSWQRSRLQYLMKREQ
ncbi:MAG: hypothetical protein PHN89_03930 [Candidatus Pacebacteria bacterium]|nr:hypothetical protein [Candidatus Paceibacterota bacterium]